MILKELSHILKQIIKSSNPKTTFIVYGEDVTSSSLKDEDVKLNEWYKKHDISANEYYLVVGRSVRENNYELMVREFMKSNSKKDLVITL